MVVAVPSESYGILASDRHGETPVSKLVMNETSILEPGGSLSVRKS